MKQGQILVVGMHRSGTSALTHLLSNMGANFGDLKDSIGANKENPKGFWERRDVRRLNDQILHALGCEWDTLTHFNLDSLSSDVRASFLQGAKEITGNLSLAGTSFVIKDPRVCLLLPLWLDALDNPLIVYIHRSPFEIAKSLSARNDFDLEFGLTLWEVYASHALATLGSVPSIFIDYKDLLNNELQQAQRLEEFFIEFGANDLGIPNPEELKGTVEASLRNQISSGNEDLMSSNQIALCKYINTLCEGATIQPDIKAVVPSMSDRDEGLLNLKKYSRVKFKYDELQSYKTSLKQRFNELEQHHLNTREKFKMQISELRDVNAELRYEKTLVSHLDPIARWIGKSKVIALFVKCLAPLSFNGHVQKLIGYHRELFELYSER